MQTNLNPDWPRTSGYCPPGWQRVSPKSVLWGLLRLAVVFGLVAWVSAAQPHPTPATNDVVFTKSVFDDGPHSGKDPFFPKSQRLARVVVTNPGASEIPELTLKGISGTPEKRLALINNYTLAVGEEGDIRVGRLLYRVRCVEIRDRSVIINYKGQTKELTLRQGL